MFCFCVWNALESPKANEVVKGVSVAQKVHQLDFFLKSMSCTMAMGTSTMFNRSYTNLKMWFLLNMWMFHCHVRFQEGTWDEKESSHIITWYWNSEKPMWSERLLVLLWARIIVRRTEEIGSSVWSCIYGNSRGAPSATPPRNKGLRPC